MRWAPDPWGDHELRLHDGHSWTHAVSDGGLVSSDAVDVTAPPPPNQRLWGNPASASTGWSGAPPESSNPSPVPPRIPVTQATGVGTPLVETSPVLDRSAADPWLAWLIALAPLLGVLVALGLSTVSGALAYSSGFVTLGLNIGLTVWDERRLRRDGLIGDGLLGWAILFIPVYLFKRQRALGQTMAIPAVWVCTFAIALASDAFLPYLVGVPLERARLESAIEQDARVKLGVSVDVACPTDITVRPGESFLCNVNGGALGTAIVTVTLINRNGDVTWVYS